VKKVPKLREAAVTKMDPAKYR